MATIDNKVSTAVDIHMARLRSANEKLRYQAMGYRGSEYKLTKDEKQLYDFVHNAPSYNEVFGKK